MEVLAARVLATHLVVGHRIHILDTQCQHPTTIAGEPLVRVIVSLRYMGEHALDGFRCTLHTRDDLAPGKTCKRAHPLESRRELESTLDGDERLVRGVGVDRVDCFVLSNGPFKGVESGLLHRVANDGAIVKFDEGMGGGEAESGVTRSVLDVQQFTGVRGTEGADEIKETSETGNRRTRHRRHLPVQGSQR